MLITSVLANECGCGMDKGAALGEDVEGDVDKGRGGGR